MRTLNRLFMASAALTCLGVAQANAAGPSPDPYTYTGTAIEIIGGGASFPSIAYRELLDCNWHPLGYDNVTGNGPLSWPAPGIDQAAPPRYDHINRNCPTDGAAIDVNLNYYYAPTGSGNGKLAFKNNSNASLTSSITTTIPITSSTLKTYPYTVSGFQFAGSDDVWNLQDQKDWNNLGNPAKYGNVVQLPALAGAVTIILNGNDGTGTALNQGGTAPTGSTSAINLTRQAVCGIFSGHITKWDNAILTAQNGGSAMGTGQITVVHRTDGSGTTFLLTNALQEQCRSITGPNSETDSTIVSYAFPWGDHSTSCPALPRGANQVDWPDQFSGHCGVTAPAAAMFTRPTANGSQALVNLTQSTNGAIGYVSPDFTQHAVIIPPISTLPITANLQNEWDISTNLNSTPTFVAPSVTATAEAMASITPVFNSTTRANPLVWSLQGVVPNPIGENAYPIAGFTWINMYQCYTTTGMSQLVKSFMSELLTAGSYQEAILSDNGFATVPAAWRTEANAVLSDVNLTPTDVSVGGTPCSGLAGAL